MSANFSRPTLTDLIGRNTADINAALAGADSRVRRSVLSVLARINAGNAHLVFGYLDWAARQIFPDTAEDDNLLRWMSIYGLPPKTATPSTGPADFIGSNGSAINIGTVLNRGDGVQYQTTTATAISGTTATATIKALVAGSNGNCDPGTILTFIKPISGVQATVTTGEISDGTDNETTPEGQARLLERLRNPPQGGSINDYGTWALQVPGVTRAFPVRHESGIGTVTVRFMMDGTYSNGIPLSADVAAVQAYIDVLKPVTAEVFAIAPTPILLSPSIRLKNAAGGTETSPAIRNAVQAELADMTQRDAVPGGTILISHINEAISVAAGEFDHVVTIPSADVTYSIGQIATLGPITWLT